ncbi:hypothetical protein AAZX31_05G017600 [Glycine max]
MVVEWLFITLPLACSMAPPASPSSDEERLHAYPHNTTVVESILHYECTSLATSSISTTPSIFLVLMIHHILVLPPKPTCPHIFAFLSHYPSPSQSQIFLLLSFSASYLNLINKIPTYQTRINRKPINNGHVIIHGHNILKFCNAHQF